MGYEQSVNQAAVKQLCRRQDAAASFRPRYFRWTAAAAVVLMAVSAYAIQDTPPAPPKPVDYGPLVEELVHFQGKLEQGIQMPALRTQSRLLALAPASTTMYVSLPNLGDAIGQLDQILHQELKESQVLNDAWQTKVGPFGAVAEEALGKFQQFSQFLGNEIVVVNSSNVKEAGSRSSGLMARAGSESILVIAEVRKPGLRAFLQQLVTQYGGKSTAILYSQQELLAATKAPKSQPLLVLVRPDFVVAATDLATLKRANAEINRGAGKFTSTPFGQHLTQAYTDGVGVLFAMDLEPLVSGRPHGAAAQEKMIQQSGFEDLKYVTANGRYVGGMLTNNVLLTFKGPRQGVAAWLAPPTQIGGLDFVSSDTNVAGAMVFKTLADIFDEVLKLSDSPSTRSSLEQAEQELKINFKQDVLKKFGNQLVFSLDGPILPTPSWKVVLQVSDPEGLQQAFTLALVAINAQAKDGKTISVDQQVENGVTYYNLRFLNGAKKDAIGYAFVDGYLILATSREIVKDAVDIHRSGRSLAKSGELRALIPADNPNGVSALIYQNIGPLMGQVLAQQSPELAPMIQPIAAHSKPTVTTAYGEENAIRVVSTSRGLDVSAILITGAIAIPNLLRSRNAANAVAAAAYVRTLNTAQVTYATNYPNRGFAPDIATLGFGPAGVCDNGGATETYACIMDTTSWTAPDNGQCTSGKWCTKDAYRYSISATCNKNLCEDFVVVATPVDPSAGKSFCSTSDGVVRIQLGAVGSPVSPSECQAWPPQ